MAWVHLTVAGILEIASAYALKRSHGSTRVVPTAVMIMALVGSLGLPSLSMRTPPIGTADTIWTGIGAVVAFLVGFMPRGEAVNPMRGRGPCRSSPASSQ